jgi:DNA-directed RNA polymerase subunit RPC12/RpoP
VSARAEGRPPTLAFVCDGCDAPVGVALEAGRTSAACPACGGAAPLRPEPAALAARRVDRCQRCGYERLYVQKDFNRTLGLWVFIVAALLSVPTWGLSLVAATIIDLALYYCLGDVTLCYACGAQHRGFDRNPAHGAFDLHIAEQTDRRTRTA